MSSFKFREASFQRHDPQGILKEYLQQVGFIWSYAHENLLPGELSQQQVLVKSKIPNLDQMIKIDKSKAEKSKAAIERINLIQIEDEEGRIIIFIDVHVQP